MAKTAVPDDDPETDCEGVGITSRLTELAIDCHDPRSLATFWCAVLSYHIIDERTDLVEIVSWVPTAEAVRADPQPPTVVFARVPEDKIVKNRLHLDLSPIDVSRDEEVEQLIALGAVAWMLAKANGLGGARRP